MIRIEDVNNQINLSFGGENFQEILSIVKQSGMKYDKDTRKWIGSYSNFYSIYEDLKDIEDYRISQEFINKIQPQKELQVKRTKYQSEYLQYQPWPGKSPYENFQRQAIIKAICQNRLLIGDEQGLGKTYESISAINHHFHNNEIDRLLIVCPTSVVLNWRRDLLKFNTFELTKDDILICDVNNRNPLEGDKKVVIMKYVTFRMISDEFYYKQNKKKSKHYRKPTIPFNEWGTERAIILDESHNIKNPKARITKVMMLHKQYFKYRYLLSGTPHPNGVNELYTQINFLDESFINKSYNQFIRSIANIGNRFSDYAINYFYKDKVNKFIEDIKPIYIRRLAKDVLELPELYIQKIYIGLSNNQKRIYQEVIKHFMKKQQEEYGEINSKRIINAFPYLVLALHNPELLKGKFDKDEDSLYNIIEKWKFKDHSKLEVLNDLLNKYINEENNKVIIWSGHPKTLNSLNEYYDKYNPICIHGQMDIPKDKVDTEYKDQLVEQFKKDKDTKILLASYLVLKEGVTLNEATRSVYFDRDWSFINWSQSIKRNHRIGQEERVIVNPLIFEESIEESQDVILDKKENLNLHLLNKALSKNDWEKIFKGEFI